MAGAGASPSRFFVSLGKGFFGHLWERPPGRDFGTPTPSRPGGRSHKELGLPGVLFLPLWAAALIGVSAVSLAARLLPRRLLGIWLNLEKAE